MVLAELPRTSQKGQFDRRINLPESGITIPVYNFRNLRDQEIIARRIADGAQMAMFGGVWGGFKGVRSGTDNEAFFHKVKLGRPKEAKVPIMIPPAESVQLIDWSRVHPDVRDLEDYERFRGLWENHGAYLHVIGPIKPTQITFPDVFETTPEDFSKRYPSHEAIPFSTACFFWRSDPYLEHFATLVKESSQTPIYIGVTSLNRHKESPPFTYEELVDHIKSGKADPRDIHLVVRDPIYERSEALGSHTQLRLPLVGERPTLKVMRIGTLSPEGFERATGIPTETMSDVADVRKNPGVNIDEHIELMNREIRSLWITQQPRVLATA